MTQATNSRRTTFLAATAALILTGLAGCGTGTAVPRDPHQLKTPEVVTIEVPHGGIQPQAVVDRSGAIHVVYFKGEATAGDLFYTISRNNGDTFSDPLAVNSHPESAVAAGAIRGAQIALGKNGTVHVAWNGSSKAQPRGKLNPEQPADSPHNGIPMLYANLQSGAESFSEQRNLMRHTFGLDGGGTLAADDNGTVLVAWHGKATGALDGEAGRQVYVARSGDNGATFAPEEVAFEGSMGACACCGMKLFADSRGGFHGLFRSAEETVHRDIFLFSAASANAPFEARKLDPWEIGACPMTSMSFVEGPTGIVAAWETDGQIRFGPIGSGTESSITTASKTAGPAKHKYPSLATNADGFTLISWVATEGWKQPGHFHSTLFNPQGEAVEHQRAPQLPVWSFGAAITLADGNFAVIR